MPVVEAEPGCGAALHAHTTEEVFMPLQSEWDVYWGLDESGVPQEEVRLGPRDAISVPAPVMRGFKNVGNVTVFYQTRWEMRFLWKNITETKYSIWHLAEIMPT
jgi:mannose-6-phosphate isomerase-like protein (cupin superfamily)